ncbi:MAG: SH3 domain-containing protein [Casimicrobium sp.]
MRIAFFLTSCFFVAMAHAGGSAPDLPTTCAFGAFVNETDPAGLNVRQSPSATAKILGTLPANYEDPDSPMVVRVELSVLASQNGWFLIDGASDNTMLTEKPARPMYAGKGWVSGKKLAIKTQASKARLAPNGAAATAFLVGNVLDGDSLSKPAQLIACTGKWVQIEYSLSEIPKGDLPEIKINPAAKNGAQKGRVRGWVNRICATQETSCDGLGNEP